MAFEAPIRLPLFPLSNVVLYPKAFAPLHIFEPRYRQMMEAALEAGRHIGMATVQPGHEEEMGGDPPLFPVGCAGFILNHEQLADGRYDLVLQGTRRFRIVREVPPEDGRLYRLAEIEWLEDPEVLSPSLREEVARRRRRVLELLDRLATRTGAREESAIPDDRLESLDDATFAGSICQALGLPAAEKQGLLETDGPAERIERLESVLDFHLALLDVPGGDGPSRLH